MKTKAGTSKKNGKKRIGITDDQAREGKQARVASEHASDCSRSAKDGNGGRCVEDHMGHRRGPAAGKIEHEIPRVTQPILDGRTEQPQSPHVQNEMQPAAMQKHIGAKRQVIAQRRRLVAVSRRLGRHCAGINAKRDKASNSSLAGPG